MSEIKQISESIFDNGKTIVPMAEVSHIERLQRGGNLGSIIIIFKHSRWVNDSNGFEPSVYMDAETAKEFVKSWCYYRSEVEQIMIS